MLFVNSSFYKYGTNKSLWFEIVDPTRGRHSALKNQDCLTITKFKSPNPECIVDFFYFEILEKKSTFSKEENEE